MKIPKHIKKEGFRAWMAYSTFRNEFLTIKSANIRANNLK